MTERNFQNRTLFHCDNLPVLRGMNSGTVDLIATDPPFNKGRDFHATPDSLASGAKFQDRWSWERDVHEEWVDQLQDEWPKVHNVIQGSRNSYGDDMGAFLCFMAVRLTEMKRVLKETGSIYLHCDPTASHYLKELMDAIFGRENFRNEIIWDYTFRLMDLPRFFNRKHDVILFYAKEANSVFNMPKEPWTREEIIRTRKQKIHVDEDGDEAIWMPGGKGHSKNKMKKPSVIMEEGKAISDVWSMPILSSSSKERTGYPTQKPLELYERMILASTAKDAWVLDPFCGCATTPVAAERLNRQWVGVDIWEKSHGIVLDRFRKEGLVAEGKAATGKLLTNGEVHYRREPPVRSDEGHEATPYLVTIEKTKKERDPYTRKQKVELLVKDFGPICQGCLREFDDILYFELDHNHPKSLGGSSLLANRILLCSPCNRIKSDSNTLKGLRRENVNRVRMASRWKNFHAVYKQKAYTQLVRTDTTLSLPGHLPMNLGTINE